MEQYYIVRAKSPAVSILQYDFQNYITTREDFLVFTQDLIDICSGSESLNSNYAVRFVEAVFEVEVLDKKVIEERATQGICRLVETQKGNAKVGYTRIRESFIYVKFNEQYLRGVKVFWGDLCKVGADGLTPLDKKFGNGNFNIIERNKRTLIKRGIRYVHNKVETSLYLVDIFFSSKEEMENDIECPSSTNLTLILESLI